MELVVKTIDIADVVFSKNNLESLKLSNKSKIEIIRNVFDVINTQLEGLNEGKIKVQGFGNFIIRNVKSNDSEKITRRIVFKGKESVNETE